MAIESLPEPVSAEPSGKVLEWLNQQKNPEFDALRDLRESAAGERKIQYEVIGFLDGLRAAVTKAAEAFRDSPTLGKFKAWGEAAHAVTASTACWEGYSHLCSVLGSRVFQSQTAKAVLLAALKKGATLLAQKVTHIEQVSKAAFLAGGIDWNSDEHGPVASLKNHIRKLRDAAEECSLEMDSAKVGQMFSKYGGLLPLK